MFAISKPEIRPPLFFKDLDRVLVGGMRNGSQSARGNSHTIVERVAHDGSEWNGHWSTVALSRPNFAVALVEIVRILWIDSGVFSD